jgi:hypothetical protein
VLGTVFGEVTVSRIAYRAPEHRNLHPADAALNLPVERHSHGLRKLAAFQVARGSFDDAVSGIERACGQQLAKRQVEELAQIAAVDFEDFYQARKPARCKRGDLLVISADGKGIVMRPDALRPPKPPSREPGKARNTPKPGSRAPTRATTSGWPRSARCMTRPPPRARRPTSSPATRTPNVTRPLGPVARNKWLTASIVKDAGTVIDQVLDDAQRRDPKHQRTWVALVDGNNHQIQRIKGGAKARKVKVTIVVDLVHVLEYL